MRASARSPQAITYICWFGILIVRKVSLPRQKARSVKAKSNDRTPTASAKVGSDSEETPEEKLEYAYQELRDDLAENLLDRLKTGSPAFFERVVLELLVAMGYGGSRKEAAERVGKSYDGGIDGIIKEDRLGLESIYVQAKRWDGAVGRPLIQQFAGALQGQRARKGVMITTSTFSKEAIE